MNGNSGTHGSGHSTALSIVTEKLLVEMMIVFGDWGQGLTFCDVQSILVNYLIETNQQNLFINGKPCRGWWRDFSKRYEKEISESKAGNISINRASSCTPEVVDNFFEVLEKTYRELQINMSKSSHIWNFDETGCNGDRGKETIVGDVLFDRITFDRTIVR